MRKFVAFVAIALGWVLLAATVTAVVLHYLPSRGTVAIYATALIPVTLLAGLGALLLFGITRRWMALALAVAALAAVCFTQAPLWVSQTVPAGEPITVVSANLLVGGADIGEVAAAAADADLVVLQEVTPEAVERIHASALTQRFRYEFAQVGPGSTGTMMLGRRPFADTSRVPNMVLNNLAARTVLPGAPSTQVLAVHPPAPLSGQAGDWAHDLSLVGDLLRGLPAGPVIVVGDFNATWDHVQYRDLLTGGYADATAAAGDGWQPTFPTDRIGGRPLAAIDRVITRGFIASSVRTFSLSGSDHRGIVVTLVAS